MGSTPSDFYVCEECKSPLIAAPSGSVCPNGHGRIREELPLDMRRRNHAIVSLGLREARQLPGGNYIFDDGGQQWEKTRGTKKITRVLDAWPGYLGDGETLAIVDGTSIIRLSPVSQKKTSA